MDSRKPPIYVKMCETERPDGTKEQILDWGHYVTNPEDYQEFSTFRLTKQLRKLNNSEQ